MYSNLCNDTFLLKLDLGMAQPQPVYSIASFEELFHKVKQYFLNIRFTTYYSGNKGTNSDMRQNFDYNFKGNDNI